MTDRELLLSACYAYEALAGLGGMTDTHREAYKKLRARLDRLEQSEPLAQFKFQEYGPPNWGDSQVTKPELIAEQKAMNEALRKRVEREPILPGGGIGRHPDIPQSSDDFERAFYRDWEAGKVKRVSDGKIMGEPEPTLDGWPLYSGLPPSIPAIKVQDKTFEEFAQSFAQSARIPEPEPVAYINVEERELEWATPIKWETPTTVKKIGRAHV
jgi:hypothetical protein